MKFWKEVKKLLSQGHKNMFIVIWQYLINMCLKLLH